jgi:hypothetical protein
MGNPAWPFHTLYPGDSQEDGYRPAVDTLKYRMIGNGASVAEIVIDFKCDASQSSKLWGDFSNVRQSMWLQSRSFDPI